MVQRRPCRRQFGVTLDESVGARRWFQLLGIVFMPGNLRLVFGEEFTKEELSYISPYLCHLACSTGRLGLNLSGVRKYLLQYQGCKFCRAVLMESEVAKLSESESLGDLSYSAQYDRLYQRELDTKKVIDVSSLFAVVKLCNWMSQQPFRHLLSISVHMSRSNNTCST